MKPNQLLDIKNITLALLICGSSLSVHAGTGIEDFQTTSLKVVSKDICQIDPSRTITQCASPRIDWIEKRQDLPLLPYQTRVIIVRSMDCHNPSNAGTLAIDLYSQDGKVIRSEEIDYLQALSSTFQIDGNVPINKFTVTSKSDLLFSSNRYPEDCEITLLISANELQITSKEDAKRVSKRLKLDLKKLQDQIHILSILKKIKEEQSQTHKFFLSLKKYLFKSTDEVLQLAQLDVTPLVDLIQDKNDLIDEDTKENIGALVDSIQSLQEKVPTPSSFESQFKFHQSELEKIEQLGLQTSEWTTTSLLETLKLTYEQELIRFKNAKTYLSQYKNSEFERTTLEEKIFQQFQEEINGKNGMIVRMNTLFHNK